MENRVYEQVSLVLIDLQIEELEQRLNALQEVVVAMSAEGSNIQEQAALLLKMRQMRSALETFRTELKEGSLAQHGDGATT